MNWIILALLIYVLLGASLVAFNMRGMQVSANAREWVMLIFLWPFMIRIFLQLAALQSRLSEIQNWAEREDQGR